MLQLIFEYDLSNRKLRGKCYVSITHATLNMLIYRGIAFCVFKTVFVTR